MGPEGQTVPTVHRDAGLGDGDRVDRDLRMNGVVGGGSRPSEIGWV